MSDSKQMFDKMPNALLGTAPSGLRLSPWSVCNQTLPDRDAQTVLQCITPPADDYTDTSGAGFYVHGQDLGSANQIGIGVILQHASAASGKTATFRFWGERVGHEIGSGPGNYCEHYRHHLFDLAVAAGAILLRTASKHNLLDATGAPVGQAAYCTTLTVSNSTVISPGVREVGYGFPMLFLDKLGLRRIWVAGKIGDAARFRLATCEV